MFRAIKNYINAKGDKQANRLCVLDDLIIPLWPAGNLLVCSQPLSRLWEQHGADPSICWVDWERWKLSFTVDLLLPKGIVSFPVEQRASHCPTNKQLSSPRISSLAFQTLGYYSYCQLQKYNFWQTNIRSFCFISTILCTGVSPSVFSYHLCHNHILASAVSASCFSISI